MELKIVIAKLQCRWFFHSHSRCRSYERHCELQSDVYVISEAFTCSDTSLRQELSKAVSYLANPGRQQQGRKLLCLDPFQSSSTWEGKVVPTNCAQELWLPGSPAAKLSGNLDRDQFIIIYIQDWLKLITNHVL